MEALILHHDIFSLLVLVLSPDTIQDSLAPFTAWLHVTINTFRINVPGK